jgi:membrane-associated protease RseP (regulator of RpoE activity)
MILTRTISCLAVAATFTLLGGGALAQPNTPTPEESQWAWQASSFSGSRLGVGVADLTEELRAHFGAPTDAGVLVSRVLEGSAAAEAGIQVGDVIVSVEDEPVSSVGALQHLIWSRPEGAVDIAVVRDGSRQMLVAELPEMTDTPLRVEVEPGGVSPHIFGHGWPTPDNPGDFDQRLEELLQETAERIELMTADMPPIGSREGEEELLRRLEDLEQRMIEMERRLGEPREE